MPDVGGSFYHAVTWARGVSQLAQFSQDILDILYACVLLAVQE